MGFESIQFCPLDIPQSERIEVGSDLHWLMHILNWFDQFKHPPLPYLVWLQCQLALAEGFTNAVRHAHKDKSSETPIEIEVILRRQAIELRIWDYGVGFDLERSLNQSLGRSINSVLQPDDELAEGGRGLKIIRQMADVFSYLRMGDQRNCLLIVKNFLPVG
jgi:serine/threonine-protein kinase RsbW